MSDAEPRRIVLIGATGVFGRRLAARLAYWSGVELMLAARSVEPLRAFQRTLERDGATARISLAVLDRDRPETLRSLQPFVVVDAAGPFQGSDFRVAEAAPETGAHYVDLADGRAFVAALPNS